MKKRIIALILALTLTFSCLSLNIFATDAESSEIGGSIVSDTLGEGHEDSVIHSLITNANQASTKLTFMNGEYYNTYRTDGSVGSENTGILKNLSYRFALTDDGRYSYGAIIDDQSLTDEKLTNDNHVTVGAHSDSNSAGYVLTNYTSSSSKDRNFVIQLDFEITEEFVKNTAYYNTAGTKITCTDANATSLIQTSTILASGNTTNANILATLWIALVKINTDNETAWFAFRDASFNTTDHQRYQIVPGTSYTLAVHVDPRTVDAANGTYGTYDVYINGECVFEDIGYMTSGENAKITLDPTVPYFSNSVSSTSWKDSTYKTLLAGSTAYFFTDEDLSADVFKKNDDGTLTEGSDGIADVLQTDSNGTNDGDGIPDIFENCSYVTADNVPIKVVALGTCDGVEDYRLGNVRFLQFARRSGKNRTEAYSDYVGDTDNKRLHSEYTSDAVYFDNIIVYYSEAYENTLVDHVTEIGDHEHDFDAGYAEITYTCALCDGARTAVEPIDANSDRVCDICSGGIGFAGVSNLSIDEFKALAQKEGNSIHRGVEVGKNADGTNKFGGISLIDIATFDMITVIEEADGNCYVKYKAPTDPTTGEAYTKNVTGEYFQDWTKASSLDNAAKYFDELRGREYSITVDLMHYGNHAYSLFELRSFTLFGGQNSGRISWVPIRITADGYIEHIDVESGEYVNTGRQLDPDVWNEITFNHTPATNSFDIYLNGECVANDIKAVKDDLDIEYNGVYTVSGIDYNIDCKGAEDYIIGMIRLTQPTGVFEKDILALDNIKIYYGDFLECSHSYKMSHLHDASVGINRVTYTCEWCGKVDAADVASFDYSGNDGIGKVLTPAEVAAYGAASGEKIAVSTEFAEDDLGGLDKNYLRDSIKLVSDDGSNYYLKYYVGTSTNSSYTQASVFSSPSSVAQNYATYRGKSYTVSMDFCLGANFNNTIGSVFEIISYLGSTTDGITAISQTSAERATFVPATISADGYLYYKDAGQNNLWGTLDKTAWYNITVYHTPENNKFDLYLNGECIAKDVTALDDTNASRLEWESANLTYSNIDYPADAPTDADGKKIFKVEGAQHFIPSLIRLPQMTAVADSLMIDNVKIYYSEQFLECKHKFTDSNKCIWCDRAFESDYCEICEGHAISAEAAVSGRSASLGELIEMNVYLALSEDLAATEGAKVVLTARDMSEEYLLSEASPEASGEMAGKYRFTLPLRSTHMAETVEVTVVAGDDVSETYTTSVVDYMTDLIGTSENEYVTALAKATLNYGAYAQVYFAGRNGNPDTIDDVLANAGLGDAEKDVSAITDLSDYRIKMSATGSGITITGASLVLSSQTTMKLYFEASADATVTVNGSSAAKIADGEEYYVAVTKYNPAELANENVIVITDGENVMTATVSILSVADAILYDASDASLTDLARAIYLYYEAASKYSASLSR